MLLSVSGLLAAGIAGCFGRSRKHRHQAELAPVAGEPEPLRDERAREREADDARRRARREPQVHAGAWREAALERYKIRHTHYGDLQGLNKSETATKFFAGEPVRVSDMGEAPFNER